MCDGTGNNPIIEELEAILEGIFAGATEASLFRNKLPQSVFAGSLRTVHLFLLSGGASLNYCREAVRTVVRRLEDWSPTWSNREGNDAVINNVPRTFVDQVSFT